MQIAFDAGHLTIEKMEDKLYLKVTNKELRENFSELIAEYFFQNQTYDYLFGAVKIRDFQQFFMTLENIAFQNKSFPGRPVQKNLLKENRLYMTNRYAYTH